MLPRPSGDGKATRMPTTPRARPKNAPKHTAAADRALRALVDDAHHRLHAATSLMSGFESRTHGAPADRGQLFAALICVEQAAAALDRARKLPIMEAMGATLGPALAAWKISLASDAAAEATAKPGRPKRAR